jgi:hypothetical protein
MASGSCIAFAIRKSYLEDHEAIALVSPSDNTLVLWAFQHSATNWSAYRPSRTFGCDLLTCTACAPTQKSVWYTRDRMTSTWHSQSRWSCLLQFQPAHPLSTTVNGRNGNFVRSFCRHKRGCRCGRTRRAIGCLDLGAGLHM